MRTWFALWTLRLTARLWNRWIICRVLLRAHEAGVVNSQQLHLLTKEFDPTQNGTVGRLVTTREKNPWVWAFEQRRWSDSYAEVGYKVKEHR